MPVTSGGSPFHLKLHKRLISAGNSSSWTENLKWTNLKKSKKVIVYEYKASPRLPRMFFCFTSRCKIPEAHWDFCHPCGCIKPHYYFFVQALGKIANILFEINAVGLSGGMHPKKRGVCLPSCGITHYNVCILWVIACCRAAAITWLSNGGVCSLTARTARPCWESIFTGSNTALGDCCCFNKNYVWSQHVHTVSFTLT